MGGGGDKKEGVKDAWIFQVTAEGRRHTKPLVVSILHTTKDLDCQTSPTTGKFRNESVMRRKQTQSNQLMRKVFVTVPPFVFSSPQFGLFSSQDGFTDQPYIRTYQKQTFRSGDAIWTAHRLSSRNIGHVRISTTIPTNQTPTTTTTTQNQAVICLRKVYYPAALTTETASVDEMGRTSR